MQESTPALNLKKITKKFTNVVANQDVDFTLEKGEIHALLGENGAGKSTLMNVVYGLYEPDGGTVEVNGRKVKINNPSDAIAHGIGMVHQHFMLVPRLTVVENIVLGMCKSHFKIGIKEARDQIQALCDKYKFQINLDAQVRDLSVGVQQRVEIIKMLYRGADILILDEPTAVLTPQEVEELINMCNLFKEQGKSIIFISHKLWEVMRLSDRITILRNGRVVSTVRKEDTTKEELANLMVGRDILTSFGKRERLEGKEILKLEKVCMKGSQLASDLKEIDLTVHCGEIVGIAGVDGNGQSELGQAIIGVGKIASGRLCFNGLDITRTHTRERLQSGMAHIPEDRLRDGVVLDFSIAENLILNEYDTPPFTQKGVFYPKKVLENAEKIIKTFDIRPPYAQAKIRDFSGGNQQKVVIARELSCKPEFMLAMQPTRGLDVGASEFVHMKLIEERNQGKGVLVISADLDELLMICDRIAVLYEGQIIGEFVPGEINYTQIGLMMGGQRKEAI